MKRREALRSGAATVASVAGAKFVAVKAAAQSTLTFGATDLDNAQAESGVVHQSTANTDHNSVDVLKQGYDYATFGEISPSPSHCWPLHEDSGSTANDVGGSADGTYNGPTLGQTGMLGTTAPVFDGIDDYVSLPDLGLESSQSFSISAWVQRATMGEYHTILARYDGNDDLLQFRVQNNDTLQLQVGHAGDVLAVNTGGNFDTGWHHVVGIYDSSGPSVSVLIDAAQEDTTSGSVDDFATSNGPWIGERTDNPGNYFNGTIADVRIYDHALSSSEVQTLYEVVDNSGELLTQPETA